MAQRESDREDLLREATALVERIELQVAPGDPPVVAGFRRDGGVSVFIGQDPVFHFNSRCHLRRAYTEGRLIKAEQGRLVALTRNREPHQVRLERKSWSDTETLAFLDYAAECLGDLRQAMAAGRTTTIGQVPPDVDVAARLQRWLEEFQTPIRVARTPHAL